MRTLEIEWAESIKIGRFVDFLIDGKSLRFRLEEHVGNRATRLGSKMQPIESSFRDELLLLAQGGLSSGRVPLYICPLCGDYGCGVVSVRVRRQDGDYVWQDFAVEDDDGRYEFIIERIGPFRFEQSAYKRALSIRTIA